MKELLKSDGGGARVSRATAVALLALVAAVILLSLALAPVVEAKRKPVSSPTLTSFTPLSGPVGTVVTLNGTALNGASRVTFNGTTASFTGVSATQIRTTVPAGALSGPIAVTTPGGTATSSTSFTVVTPPAPTLTSFTPLSGPMGTVVTLNGTDLNGASSVTFNGTPASFTGVSATQITATVPAGALSGPIAVTTPGGTATSLTTFTVETAPQPTVTSFTPLAGTVGTLVTLNGIGLNGASSVTFNGTPASFTGVSATQVTATVPLGALSGPIAVTTPGGTATSSTSFTVVSTTPATLTRYPYLTDVVSNGTTCSATINWATDRSHTSAYVSYAQAGVETVPAPTALATKTDITVNGLAEYQWKADIAGLASGTAYAYRVYSGSPSNRGADLLGSDVSPRFTTPPADSSTSYSFVVLSDWSSTQQASYEANLDAQIANSGALFALSAGDVGNPSGSQTNYGDLSQKGTDVSAVFAPEFYKAIGCHTPMFGAPGNHGFNATMLVNWPETAAAQLSGGRYQMDTYSLPGTNTATYPSVWYAFTVGSVRFYVLSAVWANSNVGSGTLYSNDYAAHWTTSSPEYQWLASDLAANVAVPVKMAVFHFPMYADNNTETTDTYLHGPGSLAGLLTQYNVQFVFNGHAHIYERNYQQPGDSFVSYVVGTGGQGLAPVGTKHAYDAYSIGWSFSSNTGSAGGTAQVPTSPAKVFSFLLVTVNGTSVTVQPINSLGEPFDGQTYNF